MAFLSTVCSACDCLLFPPSKIWTWAFASPGHLNELVQILKNTRQHLMTGVSHMIPFVVSGGILLAVSVMLYGKGAVPDA